MLHSLRFAASLMALALVTAPASAATILVSFASDADGLRVESTDAAATTGSVSGSILIDTDRLPQSDTSGGYAFAYETNDAPFLTTTLSFTGGVRPDFGGTVSIFNQLYATAGANGEYVIGDQRYAVFNPGSEVASSEFELRFNGDPGSRPTGGFDLPDFAVGQLLSFTTLSDRQVFDAAGNETATFVDARGTVRITGVTRSDAVGDVPEPATWGTMLLGFGLIGAAARRRRAVAQA